MRKLKPQHAIGCRQCFEAERPSPFSFAFYLRKPSHRRMYARHTGQFCNRTSSRPVTHRFQQQLGVVVADAAQHAQHHADEAHVVHRLRQLDVPKVAGAVLFSQTSASSAPDAMRPGKLGWRSTSTKLWTAEDGLNGCRHTARIPPNLFLWSLVVGVKMQ